MRLLNLFFIRVNIPVAHSLGAGMAVNAIQRIFAFCELSDGLIVIMQAIGGPVCPLDERHRTQIIVAAVVTGIALCIRNGRRQLMDLAFRE